MKNHSSRILSKIVSAIVIFTFLFSVISPTRAQAAPPPPVKPSQTVPGTPTPSAQPQADPAVTPVPPDVDAPQFEEARARTAMQSALDKYLDYLGPRYQTGEVELSVDGGWALGAASWISEDKLFNEPVYILAQRQKDGTWFAMLPDGSQEFMKIVESAPASLISDDIKFDLVTNVRASVDMSIVDQDPDSSLLNWSKAGVSFFTPTPERFLALPFDDNGTIPVKSGWYYNGGSYHGATDWILPYDTPVYAASNGVAMLSHQPDPGDKDGYGYFVYIKHNNGYYTLYAHLNRGANGIKVYPDNQRWNENYSEWTPVVKGQLIGYVGNTGTTFYHLHFEARTGNYSNSDSRVDPYGIYQKAASYPPNTTISPGPNYLWIANPPSFSGQNGNCSAPSLSSPNNDYVSPGSTITFSWSHANNCSGQNGFLVRVGTSSGGNDVKNDVFSPGLQGNIDFDSQWYNRDLYWSVRANANGAAWSESRHFRIEPPPASCSYNANQAVFWTGVNYSGQCVTRNIGNYPTPSSIGLPNDSISSIQVGNDVKVTLCFNNDYDGGCESFLSNDSDLRDNTITTQTSSAKVEARVQPPMAPELISPGDGDWDSFTEGQSVTLSWSATGETYTGEIMGGPSGTQNFGPFYGTTQSFSSLAAGYTYSWRVQAHNSAGPSSWSATRTFTIRPREPQYISATVASCSQINLTWFDSSSYEDGYNIYRNGAWLASVGAGGTAYQNTGLSGNTTYTYYVKAYRGNVESNTSGSVQQTTSSCIVIPPPPNLLEPPDGYAFVEGQEITLSWTATGDQYLGEVWGGSDGTIAFGPQSGTFINIGSKIPGYTYSWRVKAQNSAGPSDWSGTRTFKVLPGAPTNLVAQAPACDAVNLSWTDTSDYEDGFIIYRNDAPLASVGENVTSYTDTDGLSGETPYTYTIKAYRNTFLSNLSNSAAVTTPICPPLDTEAPILDWVAPVSNEQTWDVVNETLELTVSATDNVGVNFVYFDRWDAVNEVWVEIGYAYTSPFTVNLDASTLNLGWNYVEAIAYDSAGNSSTWEYIYLNRLTPQPDLKPYTIPGYYAPGVPSSVTGTYVPDELHAGQVTYFDWHFINDGWATAPGTFYVELWVDDTRYVQYPEPDFGPKQAGGFDDWTEIITTPGWHYVQVIVDPDNTVIESDETNNTWGEWFYWTPSAPYIDDMETEASYWWDATGLWHLATETSNYPNSYSGVSSWWYGQEDTGNYNTGAANSGDLTSPEIYIPDSETYYLRFKYWYQTESKYSAYDERWLQASIDYGEFFNVYQLYDDNMSQWHNSQVLDLSGLGGHILQIRFHFDTKDDYANAYRGWYIDDFEISTTPPPACTDGYEYNGSMEYATTISYGQTLSADICANGDYDYYKFDAQAGDFVVFDIKAFEFSSYLDSFITLLAADGTILSTNDDDGYSFDSKLGYAISDSSTYYLRVRDYYHPSYGGPEYLYDIHLYTDANDPVSAEITSPLTGAWMNPSMQTITVTADDAESGINRVEFLWHSADWQNDEWIWLGADSWGSDGWSYDFDTSALAEQQGGALYVWAFDYAGRYLGTGAWNLGIDRTAPSTTLFISSMYGGAPFRDFHITWEGSDNLSGIASYDVQVRDGLTGSWTDYYYHTVETYDRFIGEDGHTYYFQSRARDAAGNVGDYVGGNGQDSHTIQLCATGTDSYESDNSSAAAKTLTVGSAPQPHNFHAQSDEDWVKFTVQNNKIYTLSTTNTGSYADTVLSLYGVDGTTLLQFNDDYDGLNYASLIAWRPTVNGTYYAEIYHWDPYGYGCTTTYSLSLTDISPTITSLTPAYVTEGSADVPLTVEGANFTADSVIQWNGTDLPTVYVSANELTTTIPASNVTLPGTASITVFDPEYDGITSNALIFTINEWVNTPPVAVNNSYSTNEDTSKTVAAPGILGNDTDIDGDTLTAVKVTNPAHGSVTLNANGSFTYTPNANYNGADSFTYKANDGTADSNVATVNLTITAVNDTPVANDQNVSTSEDIAKSITLTASDVDGNSLTWIMVGTPAHGTLSGTAPNLSYTPSSNWSGTDAFTFKVNDGTVDSNIATVTINVTAINDPPVANNQTLSATEDTAKVITLTALDVEGAQLSWAIVSNPSHGSLTGTAPNITYTPTANYNGADTFTFKVNDGQVDSNTATITINISAVNDIPVAVNNSYTTNEDAPKTVAAPGVLGNDTDVDGNTLTAIKVTNPAHGSVTISTDGSFTYTPAANWSGTDSFTYKANDGTADSNVATVTLTVNAVNDFPVADNQNVTTIQDTPIAITLTASDIEGSSLTWVIVTNPAHGTLSGTLPGIIYTPTTGWSGVDTITFKVNDGTADSNVAMVTITVTPINTAPVATDDAYNANEDTTLTITAPGVLSNDTDADNDSLTAIMVTGPSYGTLTLNADGSFTYRPNTDWFGVDTFSYSVYDGADESNLATVTITVADMPESRPIYLPLIFR